MHLARCVRKLLQKYFGSFNYGPPCIYIDSINRACLWSILKKFGCPSKLINIIKQLHYGMMGRVSERESDGFEVNAGVKQGCVIAPSLFSLFAAMLKEATEDMPQGVSIRFRNGSVFNLSRLKASTKVTEALIRELLLLMTACWAVILSRICNKWRPSFQTLPKNTGHNRSASLKPKSCTNLLRANHIWNQISQLKACGYLSRSSSSISALCCPMMPKWTRTFKPESEGEQRLRSPIGKSLESPRYTTQHNKDIQDGSCHHSPVWSWVLDLLRRHVKRLDAFHMRHLGYLMGINGRRRSQTTKHWNVPKWMASKRC